MKEPQLHKRKLFLSDITTASSSRMNSSLSDTLAVVPTTNAIQSGANTSPSEDWLDDLFSAVPEPPCLCTFWHAIPTSPSIFNDFSFF